MPKAGRNAELKFEKDSEVIYSGSSRNYPRYRLLSIDGLNGLDVDFVTKVNPQIQGELISNMKVDARQIDIEMHTYSELRDKTANFFELFKKGKLTITWNGVSRWIEYFVQKCKIIQNSIYSDVVKIQLRLYCPQPFLLSMSNYGKNIAAVQPLIAFPFVMLRRGHIADYRLQQVKVPINNDGTVPTDVQVVFTAKGYVKNPKIILNGDKFMAANIEMNLGDVLIFNTDPNDIYVTLNGENISNLTDPMTTYFLIPVGINTIEYKTEEGNQNLSIYLNFWTKYSSM